MSRKWIVVLAVGFAIMATGCQDKPEEVTEPPVQEENIDVETPVVEEPSEPVEEPAEQEVDLDAIYTGLMDAKDQEGLRNFFIENGKSIDKNELDQMIHDYIALLESNYLKYTDPFYNGDNNEIHVNLMDIHNNSDVFNGPVFAGPDKYKVIDSLKSESEKDLVKSTFDAGYGLFMAEGSYYPVIDFKELNDYLGMFVTDTMRDYMALVTQDIEEPLTNEEYLAVDISDLKNRAYAYEAFIRENPDFKSVDYIKSNLMVAIYKLSGPNIFDGMLDQDFRLTEETREIYTSIIEENKSPILVEVAEKVLAFEAEKEGVLGSYEDMDDLYAFASATHQAAGEKVEALITN